MKTPLVRCLASIAAAAMLGSCANIQDDQTRTRVEGATAGSMIGALTGGIIGNQQRKPLEGALIGGAVGGAAGLAYGDSVARKKAGYRDQQALVNSRIRSAEAVNRKAQAYNSRLADRVDNLQAQIARAKASGDRGKLRQLKQDALALQRETANEISRVDDEILLQNTGAEKANSPVFKTNVEKLRSTKSALKKKETKLAELAKSIDV